MRQSFWPDRARKALMGPAWPWISPLDGPTFSQRVRAALEPYWAKRLQRVPDDYLSPSAREHLIGVKSGFQADSVMGAGFEKVAAAANGNPEAFWFFDLGAAAWIMSLIRLRSESWISDDDTLSLNIVEESWRQEGPARAIELLDEALADRPAAHPNLCLYRAPLALWHEGDAEGAMLALDRAVARLSMPVVGALGSTLPLTYAALFALQGDVERAAAVLEEGVNESRTPGMRGFDTAEVRYQRARYLWDLRRYDEALALIRRVLETEPAYLVRLLTDPAWLELHSATRASIHQTLAEVIGAARSSIARFQQARTEKDNANPNVRKIDETLLFVGDEPYMLLAAASLLPAARSWDESQKLVEPDFEANVERLEEFAEHLPAAFPLRLGADYAPRFVGERSDMEHLRRLIAQERYADAATFARRLVEDLPWALRMGTMSYLARLTQALATSGDVIRVRGNRDDQPRLQKIVELLERCVKCFEPAQSMPQKLGAGLLRAAQDVWREIEAIESAWVESERRHFGRMRIEIPDETKAIRRGGWTSIQIRVTDVSGQPVAGVPVLWRVASGPAFPKDPAECLDGEWGLSLHTGTVHITVEALGRGDRGVIEAKILGNYSPVEIPYEVVD